MKGSVNIKNYSLQTIASLLSLGFSFIFGSCDTIVITLICIMLIDYITGILKAIYNKNLNSYIGFKGIIKKIFMLIMVGVGNLVDNSLGVEICRNAVIFFYIANESLSIIENMAQCDVAIPNKVKDLLEQLREENNNDEKEVD